jgi:LPXTG-site transpeptidase (sortase) family protein
MISICFTVFKIIISLTLYFIYFLPLSTSYNYSVNTLNNKTISLNQSKATQSISFSNIDTNSYIFGIPISLTIPRLNIHLTIISGVYNSSNQTWTLTPDKAQYWQLSSPVNNRSGNTISYGHDTQTVFYYTKDLKIGDMLIINTSNNHKFIYVYQSSRLVLPTDTSIYNYNGKPQITLLTCNGIDDKYRRLMYFNFSQVI